jgi:hypothetical protein
MEVRVRWRQESCDSFLIQSNQLDFDGDIDARGEVQLL